MERGCQKRGCTTNSMEASEDYEVFEEKGKWEGFTVWYVKPKVKSDNKDSVPHFILSDGASFRYAMTPAETFEILKCLGEK